MNHQNTSNPRKLQDLMKEIDPRIQLSPAVEEVLLEMSEDFIDQVVDFSCLLAKHRKDTTLQVQDIAFCLEKNWGIVLPSTMPGSSSSTTTSSSSSAKTKEIGPVVVNKKKKRKCAGVLHQKRLELKQNHHLLSVLKKREQRMKF